MTVAGAIAAAACVVLFVVAAAPRSRVVAHLNALRRPSAGAPTRPSGLNFFDPQTLQASGLDIPMERLVAAKIACALVGALCAAFVALLVPIGPLVILGVAYGAFIAPSLIVQKKAAIGRRQAESAVASFVEWTHAVVLSGRPLDSAIISLARRETGSFLVDGVLARVAHLYALGAPLYISMIRESRDAGLVSLVQVAERLERSRELGLGSASVLSDMRDELRTAARERVLQSASQVEGKMTLILTLCYLPALALLVVIPLFVTLLTGLLL